MLLKYLIPLLAVLGVAFAVRTVVLGYQKEVVPPPVAEPPRAPFQSYIAASGMVEASTENVAISVAVPGLVTRVAARVGAVVAEGEPLFQVDPRELEAALAVERAGLAAAASRLARLESLPRAEELRAAEARAAEADAALADAANHLALAEVLDGGRALAREELDRRRYAVRSAGARRDEAQAQLDLARTGAWEPDLVVARSERDQSAARVASLEIQVERLTVRAPMPGSVLQVNVRPGEYAPAGVLARPLVVLGDIRALHVRVDIDENEAWRFRLDARAVVHVRGNRELSTELAPVRVEPYVIPKRNLTGDSTERVDTRVLQVLYRFDPARMPVYVGQQVDVFLEAPELPGAPAAAPNAERAPAEAR